jgi:hypothetical protein
MTYRTSDLLLVRSPKYILDYPHYVSAKLAYLWDFQRKGGDLVSGAYWRVLGGLQYANARPDTARRSGARCGPASFASSPSPSLYDVAPLWVVGLTF